MRLPVQLEPSEALVRSWSANHPAFYGVRLDNNVVNRIAGTERLLNSGMIEGLDPHICRVIASFHGPKGAKVPLSLATVTGCVRPAFIEQNEWLSPNALSCYDGGCYLYHARAVPAKKKPDSRVRMHTNPLEGLLAAAEIARIYRMPMRDNQSSDGSLSMGLPTPGGGPSQLQTNLERLLDYGFEDVHYLCFSSAFVRAPNSAISQLARFPNLVVHLTISGWHSREENMLRLNESERYAGYLPNVFLRVVNRQDWAGGVCAVSDSGARVEEWLLKEIEQRGLAPRVIQTPFHSVSPFPGSAPGTLGTRHMAGTAYSDSWARLQSQGALTCCSTGKCKTCPTACGTGSESRKKDPLTAARAFEAMLKIETDRQAEVGVSALGLYVARLLARKAAEMFEAAGFEEDAGQHHVIYDRLDRDVKVLQVIPAQRKRLVNDSHALILDGVDRHRLWAKLDFTRKQ